MSLIFKSFNISNILQWLFQIRNSNILKIATGGSHQPAVLLLSAIIPHFYNNKIKIARDSNKKKIAGESQWMNTTTHQYINSITLMYIHTSYTAPTIPHPPHLNSPQIVLCFYKNHNFWNKVIFPFGSIFITRSIKILIHEKHIVKISQ